MIVDWPNRLLDPFAIYDKIAHSFLRRIVDFSLPNPLHLAEIDFQSKAIEECSKNFFP